MRGEEAEAEKLCLTILRRFPNNPAAHVLLGDIHFDQAHLDQAKQWYEMALELTPENAALNAKLERVRGELERETIQHGVSGLEVRPPGRAAGALVASVAVLILLVAGLAFWLGNASRRTRADAIDPISINGLAPARSPNQAPEVPKEEPKAEQAPPASTQPARVPSAASGMTAEESGLLTSAAALLGPLGSRLTSLTYDSDKVGAVATLSGEPDVDLVRDSIDAAHVGAALLGQGLARVNVRVLDPASRQIRFSASMTTEALAAAVGQVGTAEWAASALINPAPPLGGG